MAAAIQINQSSVPVRTSDLRFLFEETLGSRYGICVDDVHWQYVVHTREPEKGMLEVQIVTSLFIELLIVAFAAVPRVGREAADFSCQ